MKLITRSQPGQSCICPLKRKYNTEISSHKIGNNVIMFYCIHVNFSNYILRLLKTRIQIIGSVSKMQFEGKNVSFVIVIHKTVFVNNVWLCHPTTLRYFIVLPRCHWTMGSQTSPTRVPIQQVLHATGQTIGFTQSHQIDNCCHQGNRFKVKPIVYITQQDEKPTGQGFSQTWVGNPCSEHICRCVATQH